MTTIAELEATRPGLREWSRDQYVGNECDTDEYGETQPSKGLAVCAELLEARPDLLPLVQRWVAALDTGRYDGAAELEPVLAAYHDWLWEQGRHPYDSQHPGDYFEDFRLDEYAYEVEGRPEPQA